MTAKQIMQIAVKALESKKGIDIRVIRISDVTTIAEYIVFVSGGSDTQVRALTDETEYQLGEQGVKAHHIEGKASGWTLLDYPGVIINVMTEKSREFYDLERLWSDGEEIKVD